MLRAQEGATSLSVWLQGPGNATGQAGQQLADGHELVLTVLQLLQCVPLHHVEPAHGEPYGGNG